MSYHPTNNRLTSFLHKERGVEFSRVARWTDHSQLRELVRGPTQEGPREVPEVEVVLTVSKVEGIQTGVKEGPKQTFINIHVSFMPREPAP